MERESSKMRKRLFGAKGVVMDAPSVSSREKKKQKSQPPATLNGLPDVLMVMVLSFLSPISDVEICSYGGSDAEDVTGLYAPDDDDDDDAWWKSVLWVVGWSDDGDDLNASPAFVAEGRYCRTLLGDLQGGGSQAHQYVKAKPLWQSQSDVGSVLWRSPTPIRRVDPRRSSSEAYLRSREHVWTAGTRARTYTFPLKMQGFFKGANFYCTEDPIPTDGHPLEPVSIDDNDDNTHILDVVNRDDIELTSAACRRGQAYRTEIGNRSNDFAYPIVPAWSRKVKPMLRKRIFALIDEHNPGTIRSSDDNDWNGYWLYADHRVLRSTVAVDNAVEELLDHVVRNVSELRDQMPSEYFQDDDDLLESEY